MKFNRLPDHVPEMRSGHNGLIPIFVDWFPGCASDHAGKGVWRFVQSLEHATLCRAFNLDQASYHFDIASSARGVGRAMVGAGGNGASGGRERSQDGIVFFRGEPAGRMRICKFSDKYRDTDPMNASDFYNLSGWTK